MGLGKWAVLIGGYALAPWTGGASIPIGTAIASGMNSKEGADKAVKQQQTATDQALGVNERVLAPYANRGNVAGDALMGLMGLGPLPGSQGAASPGTLGAMATPPPIPTTSGDPGMGNTPSDAPSRRVPTVQMNPDGDVASAAQQASQSSYGPTPRSLAAMGGASGNLVPIIGPNGSLYRIPQDRMQEALAQGGRPA